MSTTLEIMIKRGGKTFPIYAQLLTSEEHDGKPVMTKDELVGKTVKMAGGKLVSVTEVDALPKAVAIEGQIATAPSEYAPGDNILALDMTIIPTNDPTKESNEQ